MHAAVANRGAASANAAIKKSDLARHFGVCGAAANMAGHWHGPNRCRGAPGAPGALGLTAGPFLGHSWVMAGSGRVAPGSRQGASWAAEPYLGHRQASRLGDAGLMASPWPPGEPHGSHAPASRPAACPCDSVMIALQWPRPMGVRTANTAAHSATPFRAVYAIPTWLSGKGGKGERSGGPGAPRPPHGSASPRVEPRVARQSKAL